MTAFEAYWYRLLVSNPKLGQAESLTITPASFREQLRKAFEAGAEHGSKTRSLMDRIFGETGLRKS